MTRVPKLAALLLMVVRPTQAASGQESATALLRAVGKGATQRLYRGVFTPDGKTFLVGGVDKVIRAWNSADGKELYQLAGHNAAVHALGLAGDNLLISGGEDGSICLWDLTQRTKIGELPRHKQAIHALAVSDDGKLLATGGGTWNSPQVGELRLWDLAARKPIATLDGHRKLVLALSFTPDGRKIAAGDHSGDLKVWETGTHKPATVYHEKIPGALQFSPDGKWLAVGDYWGRLTLYDAATLNEDSAVRGHRGGILFMHYAPKGNMLVTAGNDAGVRLWDPRRLEELPPVQVTVHKDKAWMVRFAPDGQTLASAGEDGLVHFWSIAPQLAQRFQLPLQNPVPVVRAGSGPAKVAIVCSEDVEAARNVQDLAMAKLSVDNDVILLERAAVERLPREQKLTLTGLVDANSAVKAGKILAVDLLAVVEHSSEAKQNTGVAVFDAATGVKLGDVGFTGANPEPQALQTATSISAAAAKWRAGTKNLKTLCVLPARNADLPRSMDRFCETLGAMLERELLSFDATALLERKRLDLVNKEKTLAADVVNRELLASLVVLEMEVSRTPNRKGIRAVVVLRDNAGAVLHRITHEIDAPTGEGLLAPLSAKIQEALKTTAPNAQANRNRESRRFLREAELLWKHKYYVQGWQAAEAAFALKPNDDARHLLAEYLMRYATELLHPGGMRTTSYGTFELKVAPEKVREALDLARRGMQLMEASRSPMRMISDWVAVDLNLEPILIADARRFLFNKVPFVRVVPENAEAQQELDDFRVFCLQRVVDRCLEATRGSAPDAKTLDRFTYVIQDSITSIREIAPSRPVFTRTMHELAMKWLDVAQPLKPETISAETAAKFGEFLSQVYLPNLLPGKPAADVPLEAFERALKHPHPIVRLYADHAYTRLMFVLEKLPRDDAIARHRALLAEGRRLIDNPTFPPHAIPYDKFRVAVYRLLNDAIGHVYLHTKGKDVVQEYLDLCDFMLERNDVIEDVVRAAVGYGSVVHEQNLKALEIIDKALEVTDSPKRRYFADSPDRFKFYMKDARRKVLAALPDVAKKAYPWESVTPLVTSEDLLKMNTTLIIAALVRDKHIYYFTGGEDPATKHRLLQLWRMPADGGPGTLVGKTLVAVSNPPAPRSYYIFWTSPEPFITSTAIAHGKLYAGTVSEGILVFPLAGGPPTRIDEKEGLPSKSVHKLAIVDDTLVVGLEGGYISTHDLKSGRTDTIASSRRAEKLSPLDNSGPFRLWALAADSKRQRVLFQIATTSLNDPKGGLWEYSLASRQFTKLQPAIVGDWSPVIGDRIYLQHVDGLNRHLGSLVAYDLAANEFARVHGPAPKDYGKIKSIPMPADLSIPFARHLLHQNHYWSVYPFGRCSLDGKSEEALPSLRDLSLKSSFSARVSLQALSLDELLIGDLLGLYLVRLKAKK